MLLKKGSWRALSLCQWLIFYEMLQHNGAWSYFFRFPRLKVQTHHCLGWSECSRSFLHKEKDCVSVFFMKMCKMLIQLSYCPNCISKCCPAHVTSITVGSGAQSPPSWANIWWGDNWGFKKATKITWINNTLEGRHADIFPYTTPTHFSERKSSINWQSVSLTIFIVYFFWAGYSHRTPLMWSVMMLLLVFHI